VQRAELPEVISLGIKNHHRARHPGVPGEAVTVRRPARWFSFTRETQKMRRKVLETITTVLPDGRNVTMKLIQSPHRAQGRQIVVYGDRGEVLHDTDTHYDQANAEANLGDWIKRLPRAMAVAS
jgi:hypothetical protein